MRPTTAPTPTLESISLDALTGVTGGCKKKCKPQPRPEPQPQAAPQGDSVSTNVSISY